MAFQATSMAMCECGQPGSVVDHAAPLEVHEHWFVIEHEGGDVHKVERFWNGEAFRFRTVTQ